MFVKVTINHGKIPGILPTGLAASWEAALDAFLRLHPHGSSKWHCLWGVALEGSEFPTFMYIYILYSPTNLSYKENLIYIYIHMSPLKINGKYIYIDACI